MTKTKNQKPLVRCQNRSWEVVLNFGEGIVPPSPETVMKYYCSRKYGVYRGFIYPHSENDSTHYHIGLIFRDVPKTLYWNDVTMYFDYEGCKTSTVRPLKSKARKFDKKLQQYYDYCCSEEQHPHQKLGTPYHYKWEPVARTEDGIDLDKCGTKVYVQHYIEQGATLRQIFELAPITRRADICQDWYKYKKQEDTYKMLMKKPPETHPITSFRKDVVDHLLKVWDPKKQSLILHGASNMGKTELAKSLVKHITKKDPKVLSNMQGLKWREPQQPIVYDDMNFQKCSRSKVIHLLDTTNDRDIRVLFGSHIIEGGTPRIFCTNEEDYDLFPPLDEAHRRRMCWVDLFQFTGYCDDKIPLYATKDEQKYTI